MRCARAPENASLLHMNAWAGRVCFYLSRYVTGSLVEGGDWGDFGRRTEDTHGRSHRAHRGRGAAGGGARAPPGDAHRCYSLDPRDPHTNWPAHNPHPAHTPHIPPKWAVVVAVREVGWLSAISYLCRLDACPHSCRVAPAGGGEPIRRGPWRRGPLHPSTSPPLPPHLSTSLSTAPSGPLHWRCLRPSRRLLQHRSCGAPLVERRNLEGELPVYQMQQITQH